MYVICLKVTLNYNNIRIVKYTHIMYVSVPAVETPDNVFMLFWDYCYKFILFVQLSSTFNSDTSDLIK